MQRLHSWKPTSVALGVSGVPDASSRRCCWSCTPRLSDLPPQPEHERYSFCLAVLGFTRFFACLSFLVFNNTEMSVQASLLISQLLVLYFVTCGFCFVFLREPHYVVQVGLDSMCRPGWPPLLSVACTATSSFLLCFVLSYLVF